MSTPALSMLTRVLVLVILSIGMVRAVAFVACATAQVWTPFEAYHLESKMVHLAWRVQHGLDLYPPWLQGPPYVANFFGPIYFLVVGWIGRLVEADLWRLSSIGRLVTLAAVAGGSLLVAHGAWRRHGGGATASALTLSLGAAPMFGFASMTRPDALADALGLSGFLIGLAQPRAASIAAGIVLAAAALTKQPAGVYAIAALGALVLQRRATSAAWLGATAATAVAAAIAVTTVAAGPGFARGLVAEADTGWTIGDWTGVLWRLWMTSPDLLVFAGLGLIIWTRRASRDRPLAILCIVVLAAGVVTSGKKGAELNYFLALRNVEAFAVASLLAVRRAPDVSRWILPAMLIAAVSLVPSLWHAAAQARYLQAKHADDQGLRTLAREYVELYALASDPSVRVLTDNGAVDIRQGERALFGDPWLFRVLAEEGRIDVSPVVKRVEAGTYDWIVTSRDLADPSYRTYDFGLPEPILDAARRHVVPVGRKAGLFVYRPRLRTTH